MGIFKGRPGGKVVVVCGNTELLAWISPTVVLNLAARATTVSPSCASVIDQLSRCKLLPCGERSDDRSRSRLVWYRSDLGVYAISRWDTSGQNNNQTHKDRCEMAVGLT